VAPLDPHGELPHYKIAKDNKYMLTKLYFARYVARNGNPRP
jgi:hypothetical protein